MPLKLPAWKIFFALAVLCALTSEFFQHVLKRSEREQVEFAQQKILALEKKMQESLESISTFTSDSQYHEFFIHSGQQYRGFSFFYFDNDSLKYWSNNEIILPDNVAAENIPNGSSLKLPNGIYEAFEKSYGNKKILGLILLYRDYSYENKYLVNHFNRGLQLDEQFRLANEKGDDSLLSITGKPLVALSYSHVVPDELPVKKPAWFYLFAFLFLMSGLFFFFQSRKTTFLSIAVTGISLFVLRYLMIYFRLPGELYYNDFFSPKVYGSSFFFNSIGDFFLNAVTCVIFSGILYDHFRKKHFAFARSGKIVVLLVLTIAFLSFLFYTIQLLTGDLVLNSKIVFDPSIADLDVNTFIAALSILLLLWSYYLWFAGLLLPFRNIFPLRFSAEKISSFRTGLVVLPLVAIYSTFLIHGNLEERKSEDQKRFAQRLDSRRDQLAEYLFRDLQKRMINDETVKSMIDSGKNVNENISQYLQQNFFTGYFAKFDVDVDVYDSHGNPCDSSSAISLLQLQQQFTAGKPTASSSLSLQPDETGKLKYLALIAVGDSTVGSQATISAMLTARSSQLTEGFPELLVSNAVTKNRDEASYSYARYSNGSLIYAGGNFPYPFHSGVFEKPGGDFYQVSFDDYEHVIYQPAAASYVVVSRPAESFFDTLSLFSYLLLFFLIFFLLTHFLFYLLSQKNKFQLSLKQRIRSSIISLVVVSFALIATGTSVYIVRKYDADKNRNILSRLNSMWFAITDKLSFENKLSAANSGQWTADLNNMVSSFNLDFNLYDETGKLFYSSQPKLFEKGILSARINPEAFSEMQQYGKTQYIHQENIGTLNYAAGYAAFTDRTGNIAGYLNIPYFEKQNELNKEISGFLSALINLYLLLLAVALVLALLITSRITKPLLLIQERLSLIRLGSRNEIIEWKRNDEIGQLVQQYNKMVEALAESADKLTRSERESAWREMAQQVAHEIKNPLTPMKLSIQHLQRAWNEKSGNLDELFQRISKTMIEQIDTLSNIASEFSNFAKMPRARNEELDLDEILSSSINLFNDTPGVNINYERKPGRKIFADREQLIRAFSNLLKNAIQSIPENKKGEIVITVKTENNFHVISIADNGKGIPSSLQSKIFTPSFTTKSSGMGLGLAMVKSTVDAAGGTIRFETEDGKGSVFYVSIPQLTAN